jgi:hypothetical protein
MLDIYKLQHQYISLRSKTRALQSTKVSIPVEEAEGYEFNEKNQPQSGPEEKSKEVKALRSEWRVWKLASIKNAYVPSSSIICLSTTLPSFPCPLSTTPSSGLSIWMMTDKSGATDR